MKLKDIKDVLTFAAFRPEPDDRLAAWTRRFSNQRTLLLNVGRGRTSWKGLGKGGRLVDGGVQYGEFKDLAPTLAHEWRGLTDEGWCAVSLNSRYVISLETNVSRKPGVEEILRTNPRAVLGARYERGKRYLLTNNPESVATLLLAVDEEQIKQIEGVLRTIGLHVGRICCGTYALLRRLLESVHTGTEKNQAPAAHRSAYLDVVCCEGSICAMLENGDLWKELRSRSDLYKDDDAESVIEILQPLIARHGDDVSVRFVADQADSLILEKLRARLPGADITDHSREDHLWRVMADS